MTIFLRCLDDGDFVEESIKIPGYAEKLECITVFEQEWTPSQLNCFIGTAGGKLLCFCNSTFFKTSEVHNKPEEGPVN